MILVVTLDVSFVIVKLAVKLAHRHIDYNRTTTKDYNYANQFKQKNSVNLQYIKQFPLL